MGCGRTAVLCECATILVIFRVCFNWCDFAMLPQRQFLFSFTLRTERRVVCRPKKKTVVIFDIDAVKYFGFAAVRFRAPKLPPNEVKRRRGEKYLHFKYSLEMEVHCRNLRGGDCGAKRALQRDKTAISQSLLSRKQCRFAIPRASSRSIVCPTPTSIHLSYFAEDYNSIR